MDVSIIITAYTDRGYLVQAINDAKKQRFKGDYEIILASDANPKLERYAKEFGVRYAVTKRRLGFSNNFNNASKIAKGKYLKVLADDDRLPANSIQTLYDQITSGDYAIVHANGTSFSGTKAITKYKPKIKIPTLQEMLLKNHLHGGTIMIKTDVFREVGMYNYWVSYSEEYELYLRLLSKGYKFTYVDKFVYLYRVHKTQKSTLYKKEKDKIKALIKNYYGI